MDVNKTISMVKNLLDNDNFIAYVLYREKLASVYHTADFKKKRDKRHCGVYCLYDGDELVYIGFSENLISRVKSHINTHKKWDRARVFVIDEVKIARGVETTLLLNFKTRYNSFKNRTCFNKRMEKGLPVADSMYRNFISRINRMVGLYRLYESNNIEVNGSYIKHVLEKKEIYSQYVNVTYEEYEKNFKLRLAGKKHDMYMI